MEPLWEGAEDGLETRRPPPVAQLPFSSSRSSGWHALEEAPPECGRRERPLPAGSVVRGRHLAPAAVSPGPVDRARVGGPRCFAHLARGVLVGLLLSANGEQDGPVGWVPFRFWVADFSAVGSEGAGRAA